MPPKLIVDFEDELAALQRCLAADSMPTVDQEVVYDLLFDAASGLCDFDRFADTAHAMAYGEAMFSRADMTPEQCDQIYRVVMRTIERVQVKLHHYGAYIPAPWSATEHIFPYVYVRSTPYGTVLFKQRSPDPYSGYF